MNNTISSVCLPKIHTYSFEDQRIVVRIRNNSFDFTPQTLFSLAARKNKKRGFLFVSNVLGKHVPVNPLVPLLAGAALAVQFLSKVHGLDHPDSQDIIEALKNKQNIERVYETVVSRPQFALPTETLFIGFAETATGLGHAAFSLFDNGHYLHTTREHLPGLTSELNFNEDHSHAVNHCCYPLDSELLKTPQTIVLVDDEITTGNTALNIIRAIHHKFPKANYIVLSLLDWRTDHDRTAFSRLEQQLDIEIRTISLLEGEIEVSGDWVTERQDDVSHTLATRNYSELKVSPELRDFPEFKSFLELKFLNIRNVVPVFSEDSIGYKNSSPYLKVTGRFGLSSSNNLEILPLAQKIGEELKNERTGEKTLCLGTGEFMYFPMLISAYMGEGVSYHSTTRSPIYAFSRPYYAIQNGFAYQCPDDWSITNYIYNVPLEYYDEIYVFLEREVSFARLIPMLTTFRELGIPRLVLVIGSSTRDPRSAVGVH